MKLNLKSVHLPALIFIDPFRISFLFLYLICLSYLVASLVGSNIPILCSLVIILYSSSNSLLSFIL